jgi:hypothetical protein
MRSESEIERKRSRDQERERERDVERERWRPNLRWSSDRETHEARGPQPKETRESRPVTRDLLNP